MDIIHALTILVCLSGARGWHDLGNVPHHCWPKTASADNPASVDCLGINLEWIVPPPAEVKPNADFNVSYELTVDSTFYVWAVNNGFFATTGGTGFVDGPSAQAWCENTQCPADVADANEITCCIHHVNVHSCPLGQTENSLCGPWIPKQGTVFTHSQVLIGPVQQGVWTSHIPGLYEEGMTSIIAHFKLADLHLAIEAKTKVLPKTVCGDGNCASSDGEDCDTCPKDCGACPLPTYAFGLIAMVCALLVGAGIGVVCYFRYQKRKMLWDEKWIVTPDDIKEDKEHRAAFGSMISMNIGSDGDITKEASMNMSAMRKQVFANTAILHGRTVVVRKVAKKEFSLTEGIRHEVKDVRECDHQNLCKFLGGCVVAPDVCIINEYCPKGSICDILLNEDVPINWPFRFSFVTDIARGMEYLHERKLYHGRLKSSNCVVDDRWTVKITDYGLNMYRKQDKMMMTQDDIDDEENKEIRNRVYKAPEIAQVEEFTATAAIDVYAYSIILIEVATRSDPFEDEDPYSVSPFWKPELPDLTPDELEDKENCCQCPDKFTKLIKECWDNDPSRRPAFQQIKKNLHVINPNKMSPVDLMMNLMEKYSKHLQSIVAERTQDLLLEKQKTDKLLYSMLPRTVADDLKYGRTINAESFEACTIYFSDIVGFTNLAGGSSPMEVVALLNHLYITFDNVIDNYDVYKVETIGDAYMVVSGIPNKTPFHACEIADMALDLVKACKTFVIPHKPGEPLKIRVGLHSGPACAGVVGLKMPRYCLFGDTVNTASRMESNGEAYKVHISNFTYLELLKRGDYDIEFRGVIPIKGKGEMKTWWLNGRAEPKTPFLRKEGRVELPSEEELKCLREEHERAQDLTAADNEGTANEEGSSQEDLANHNNKNHVLVREVTATDIKGILRDSSDASLGLEKDNQLFTRPEFPDMNKNRKISNISNSNDSGYNEKTTDESSGSVQDLRVSSCVSLKGEEMTEISV